MFKEVLLILHTTFTHCQCNCYRQCVIRQTRVIELKKDNCPYICRIPQNKHIQYCPMDSVIKNIYISAFSSFPTTVKVYNSKFYKNYKFSQCDYIGLTQGPEPDSGVVNFTMQVMNIISVNLDFFQEKIYVKRVEDFLKFQKFSQCGHIGPNP